MSARAPWGSCRAGCAGTHTDPDRSPEAERGGGVYTLPPSSEPHQAPPFPALTTEGIFRRSANTQVVREVQQKYNMGEWSGHSPRHSGRSRWHEWGLGVEGVGLGACV